MTQCKNPRYCCKEHLRVGSGNVFNDGFLYVDFPKL